ncbi:hypothetical protein [Spirosoma soli]
MQKRRCKGIGPGQGGGKTNRGNNRTIYAYENKLLLAVLSATAVPKYT